MEIAVYTRTRDQRMRLQGVKCPNCDTKYFPPVKVCKMCTEDKGKIVFISVSKSPSYTSDNCMALLQKELLP